MGKKQGGKITVRFNQDIIEQINQSGKSSSEFIRSCIEEFLKNQENTVRQNVGQSVGQDVGHVGQSVGQTNTNTPQNLQENTVRQNVGQSVGQADTVSDEIYDEIFNQIYNLEIKPLEKELQNKDEIIRLLKDIIDQTKADKKFFREQLQLFTEYVFESED